MLLQKSNVYDITFSNQKNLVETFSIVTVLISDNFFELNKCLLLCIMQKHILLLV